MAEGPMIGVADRELDDLALEALAEAHATPPPPGLRARILADARRTREARALRRWRMVAVGTVAAAVALAWLQALTSARAGAQLATLARTNAELRENLDAQTRMLASLREALATQANVLRVLGGARTITASLAPQPGVAGTGRVIVDAASGDAAVIVSGLEPAAHGKTYELWAIRGDRPPEPAGVFAVGPERWATARVERVARPEEVTTFAVSVEPTGGSKAPTGPIVLVGRAAG